jgi:hypothetical protein
MTLKTICKVFVGSVLVTSCSTVSTFYQLYKTQPDKNLKTENGSIFFSDDNCTVTYNLWQNEGDIGFILHNNSSEYIYINKDECFFIINGFSFNYYKNRIITYSTSSGASTSRTASGSQALSGFNHPFNLLQTNQVSNSNSASIISSSGYSISETEERIISIPPNTSKIINEYNINTIPFRDCNILMFPNSKNIKTATFTKDSSPLVFGNMITYSVGNSSEYQTIYNEFFVTEITNYPNNKFIEKDYETYCGKESTVLTEYFRFSSPDRFYVRYSSNQTGWKKLQ